MYCGSQYTQMLEGDSTRWEGDELVTYDYPTLVGLLEYYEKGEYLPDND